MPASVYLAYKCRDKLCWPCRRHFSSWNSQVGHRILLRCHSYRLTCKMWWWTLLQSMPVVPQFNKGLVWLLMPCSQKRIQLLCPLLSLSTGLYPVRTPIPKSQPYACNGYCRYRSHQAGLMVGPRGSPQILYPYAMVRHLRISRLAFAKPGPVVARLGLPAAAPWPHGPRPLRVYLLAVSWSRHCVRLNTTLNV